MLFFFLIREKSGNFEVSQGNSESQGKVRDFVIGNQGWAVETTPILTGYNRPGQHSLKWSILVITGQYWLEWLIGIFRWLFFCDGLIYRGRFCIHI